ncbi:MAG: neuraminidase-like domain-containing protein, partial [Vulcanimicrobiaceae bacterium]
LLDVFDWYDGANYTLDQIAVATGGTPLVPASFKDAGALAAQIVASAATALSFNDTVFSVALGTTEIGSKDLISSNPTVIEAGANSTWRLVAGIDLATIPIVIPPTATVPTPPSGTRALTDTEARVALQPYVASQILTRSVGSTFGFTTDKVQALAAMTGVSLTANAIVTAVRGDGPIAPLVTLVGTLIPVSVIFSDAAWDAAATGFAGANAAVFGAGPLPAIVPDAQHPNAPFVTLSQLRALATYTRIAERLLATSTPGAATATDLQTVLAAFDSGIPGFPAATDATMARVLGVPQGLVVGLRALVVLPATAAPALDRLDVAAQTAVQLGVDGQTFAALINNDYDALSHAADALIAVLRTTITDQAALATKLDEIEQPVRAAKRDALADYLIHSITPQIWTSLQQLYEYFLIDVQAGGCETTSLVVAATMSAQLYVYRALMNLEQDNRLPNDPLHFVLTVPSEAAAEWEWRKNYRVWQANREVFLWPENYMIPDLRDDKTPLFEQIEQELLQTDLTDQNVFDAYTKYLSGLQEVASLTIAGAYHEKIASGQQSAAGGVNDVLHLFGCTADDPPTYYYRTCQNLIRSRKDVATGTLWSAWQKVSVQITSRRVAPVVFYGRLFVFWSDVKTKPKNSVSGGASQFTGYQHQLTIKFTSLRADGVWTAPQQLRLPPGAAPGLLSDPFTEMFGPARGQVTDPLLTGLFGIPLYAQYDVQQRLELDPIDDYTLSGPNWDGIWPYPWTNGSDRGLEIMYRNFIERRQVDLFTKTTYDLSEPWNTDAQKPYPQILCAKNGNDTKPLY